MTDSASSQPDERSIEDLGPYAPLARPPFQLRSLPIRYRWEVTRRHAYYQDFWDDAQAYHQQTPVIRPEEHAVREAAVALLALIGVSGEPVDPATSFEELGADDILPAWLSGAVHPITLRGLAGILIAYLPRETLAELGLIFHRSVHETDASSDYHISAFRKLGQLKDPGLDTYPDEPFVSVNPAASERQVAESLSTLLKQWKQERGLSEQRDRSDKYPEYLQVWDLREGWTDGGYDLTQEKSLKEVARELSLPVTTVANHYRRAFELITGHEYSRELWLRVFGLLKLSEWGGAAAGRMSSRRPRQSPSRRDVPESVLQSNRDGDSDAATPVNQHSAEPTFAESAEVCDLVLDIQERIDGGQSDEEIVEVVLIRPEAREETRHLVAYIRQRGGWP